MPKSFTVDVESTEALNELVAQSVTNGYRVEATTTEQAVLVPGTRPNHILHLLLSIFRAGLWLPIWALITLGGGETRQVIRVVRTP
jgi:hypothetical protein